MREAPLTGGGYRKTKLIGQGHERLCHAREDASARHVVFKVVPEVEGDAVDHD
jgi:hypothetical protein